MNIPKWLSVPIPITQSSRTFINNTDVSSLFRRIARSGNSGPIEGFGIVTVERDETSGEGLIHVGSSSIEYRAFRNSGEAVEAMISADMMYSSNLLNTSDLVTKAWVPYRFKYGEYSELEGMRLYSILKGYDGKSAIVYRPGIKKYVFRHNSMQIEPNEWVSLVRPINVLPNDSGSYSPALPGYTNRGCTYEVF